MPKKSICAVKSFLALIEILGQYPVQCLTLHITDKNNHKTLNCAHYTGQQFFFQIENMHNSGEDDMTTYVCALFCLHKK